MTLSNLLVCLLGCLVCVGFPVLLIELWSAKRTQLSISQHEVRITSGLLVRRVEIVDLARVRDVAFEAALGWETIILHSSDARSPVLRLCFKGAGRAFDPLRVAVTAARKPALAVHSL